MLADPAPAALTPAGLDPVVVHVGVSAAKTQTVPLPGLGFTVSPVPHNKQGAGWKDRFAVSVAGDACAPSPTSLQTAARDKSQLHIRSVCVCLRPLIL